MLIIKKDLPSRTKVITWKPLCLQTDDDNAGLTLEGDSGEEVVLVPKEKWKSPCNFTKSLC